MFAIASPCFICFVHVPANVTILITQAHENRNDLLRAAACTIKLGAHGEVVLRWLHQALELSDLRLEAHGRVLRG
jgi:hypothetical protein